MICKYTSIKKSSSFCKNINRNNLVDGSHCGWSK